MTLTTISSLRSMKRSADKASEVFWSRPLKTFPSDLWMQHDLEFWLCKMQVNSVTHCHTLIAYRLWPEAWDGTAQRPLCRCWKLMWPRLCPHLFVGVTVSSKLADCSYFLIWYCMTCLGLFICNLLEGGVGHGRSSELFVRSLELFLKCLELYVNSLERLIKCSQPCFVSMQKKTRCIFPFKCRCVALKPRQLSCLYEDLVSFF